MDTAYLAALLRQRDQFHLRAKRWDRYLEQRNVRLIVTEAVLWEWLNGCCERALRAQAAQGYRFLHQDERVEVIPFQPAQMEAAFALYEARSDKEWSMTDCLSFLVLQERGLTDALTPDHHFEQAGFRALFLEEPPT